MPRLRLESGGGYNGYRAPQTLELTKQGIRDVLNADYLWDDVCLWHLSHNPPKEEATRPGSSVLFRAMSSLSPAEIPVVAASLAEHEDPSSKSLKFMKERGGTVKTLNQILGELPVFQAAKQADPMLKDMPVEEIMRRHGEWVHLHLYLNSHDIALRQSLKTIGIVSDDEGLENYIADLLDDETLHVASFVNAAVGSWLLRNKKANDLVDRDDWPPANVVRSLSGFEVRADISNNHGPVTPLERILKMHHKLQQYQLELFGNMIRFNDVVVLHTKQDAHNLATIADYLKIPPKGRALIHVRNLMPPSFVEFKASDPDPETAASFIREAVKKGRIIAGVVERLDLIKMDPLVLDHFEELIKQLSQTDNSREMLKNFRIAWISRPANFPQNWKMFEIYGPYNEFVDKRIKEINALFRRVMGEIGGPQDEDFILTSRHSSGQLAGYPHEQIKDEFYPFVNTMFQLGQEGLCQTVQEGMLTTAFGLTRPRPATVVISRLAGFSEKAEDNGLDNVKIVEDPTDTAQVVKAFVDAYNQAVMIRDNPDSTEIETLLTRMEKYYDSCGDSFYVEVLAKLKEVRRARFRTLRDN